MPLSFPERLAAVHVKHVECRAARRCRADRRCVCAHAGIVMILLTQPFPNQAPLAAPMAVARTPLLVELCGVQKLLDSVQKSASRDVIAQAQEARIIAIVRKTTLTSEECSEAVQMAEKIWPNSSTVIEHLCGAVGDHKSKGRPPLQNFAALAEYYTESQWKKMRSSGSCVFANPSGAGKSLGPEISVRDHLANRLCPVPLVPR